MSLELAKTEAEKVIKKLLQKLKKGKVKETEKQDTRRKFLDNVIKKFNITPTEKMEISRYYLILEVEAGICTFP